MADIAAAIRSTRTFLGGRPDRGSTADTPVTATLESGLRCSFVDEFGTTFTTDMPTTLGGDGAAPSPGHYVRGAIATCATTAIAMRAAEMDIAIESLSVTAESTSDNRAFLGMRDGMVGFAGVTIAIDLTAPQATSDQIDELLEYAAAHAPVTQSIEHPVPVTVNVQSPGD